ncbi:MAG TPA: hypothetical protein VIJ79_04800 [Acidobacteriaceae bacterium]
MKIKDLVRPDFPNAELSFWKGFASVFDFRGRSRSREFVFDAESDAKALERDWRVVGEDMRKAFDRAGCR